MTRRQFVCAVAEATGEAPCTIRDRGFHVTAAGSAVDLDPEDLVLAVACPFCGGLTAIECVPGVVPEVVGCGHCDIEFLIAPEEIQPVDHSELASTPSRHTVAA